MNDAPLGKPDHLRDVPTTPTEWMSTHLAGLAALVLGVISFTVVAIVQEPMWTTPPWQLSVPGVAAAALAALVSLRRREGTHWLWIVGLGLAAASTVLGWFLMFAIVIGGTAVLMLILNVLM